jgi:hypothetical protein
MDDHCDRCGFEYASVDHRGAARRVREEAGALTAILRPADPVLAAEHRIGPGWSATEYGGHVRDVLVNQRERVLTARAGTARSVVAMGRDERVRWGEYAEYGPAGLAQEIVIVASWLARTLDLLRPSDWSLSLVYNYPEPTERSLEWLAAHTVHELVHHRGDIERLIAAG